MEGADQILPLGSIDADLASHRRVEHREERGGHLGVGHAAAVGGGDKSSHVSHDTTADGHDRRVAPEATGQKLVGEADPGLAGLRSFTGGEDQTGLGPDRCSP